MQALGLSAWFQWIEYLVLMILELQVELSLPVLLKNLLLHHYCLHLQQL
jgi:hypothetical protein